MCLGKRTGMVAGFLVSALLSTCPVFANEDVVKKCLTASIYPDADDLIYSCDVALKTPNLSEMTLANLNLHMGSGMLYSHRYDLSLSYFRSAIGQNPQLVQAYIELGIAQFELGRYLDSVDSLGNALAIDPNNLQAQFALTLHKYSYDGNCEAAVQRFKRILEKDPNYYLVRYNLAEFYKCSRQSETLGLMETEKLLSVGYEKLSIIPMVSRKWPLNFDLYTKLQVRHAQILANLEKYDLAIKDYDEALTRFPKSDYLYVARADQKTRIDRASGSALEDYEKALAIFPKNGGAASGKIRILDTTKRYNELVKFANHVIESKPTTETKSWIYYWRGLALKKLGNTNDALKDYKKTILNGSELITTPLYNSLIQHGYLKADFSWVSKKPPDLYSKEFANALEACVIDPECY